MNMGKIAVERFKVLSSRPFDAVVTALKSAVGQPDWNQFVRSSQAATSASDFERVVQCGLGRTGFMLFAEFDLGAVLRRESKSNASKTVRFQGSNPLIMKEMVKHAPDAGSYAPITILVDERPDGVHLSYDWMESYKLSYGGTEALAVARDLDAKITTLLRDCAG